MKHVLHLVWDGGQGGVQRYVNKVTLSEHWKKYTHSILIFTEEGEVLNTDIENIKIIALNINTNTQVKKCFTSIKKFVLENDVDIIHCHCDTLLFLSQLRLFKSCKLVYTEHGDSFVRNSRQALTRFLWRCNGSHWDKVIQNSFFTERLFVNKFNFLEGKTAVLSNPLLETVEASKRTLNDNAIHFGSLGRLEHVKGNDLFIQAAARITKILPQAIFHIFGQGSEKETLVKQCEELGVSENFIFHGFTDKPLEEMKKLDCLVVPSRKESFGLVALEALSVGTPVAAFAGTGISDFLTNGQSGYLAEPENPESLAQAMFDTVRDKKHWQDLSKHGKKTARNNYSLSNHIEKLEALYDSTFITEQQKEIA